MKTRHARRIREGILLGRKGDIDAGMRLRGIGWKAFFKTNTKDPQRFAPLFTQHIIISTVEETQVRGQL